MRSVKSSLTDSRNLCRQFEKERDDYQIKYITANDQIKKLLQEAKLLQHQVEILNNKIKSLNTADICNSNKMSILESGIAKYQETVQKDKENIDDLKVKLHEEVENRNTLKEEIGKLQKEKMALKGCFYFRLPSFTVYQITAKIAYRGWRI